MTDGVFTLLPSLSLPGPVLKEICKQINKNTKNAKSSLFKPVALYLDFANCLSKSNGVNQ